jgi:hypothetical protein
MGIASKLLLTTIFAAPPLGAQGNINADLRDIGDLSRYIHKTASYNEEIIPRKLVASMARQDQERVAATAQIKCPGGRDTSAQVTLKDNLITTAAHAFTDRDTCKQVNDPKTCSFVIRIAGKTLVYPIADRVAQGFQCPTLPRPRDDWAVVRLKYSVAGVEPYLIDENKARNLAIGDRVVTVSHSMDFNRTYAKDGAMILPKHYGTCAVAKLYGRPVPYFMSAPCGCSEGCSGGSLLTDEPRPALLGVVSSNAETDEQRNKEINTGKPVKVPYGELTGTTYFVPFTGDFLRAVKKAADGP